MWEGAAALLHLVPLDPLGRSFLLDFSFSAKVLLIKMFTKCVYVMTCGSELYQKLVMLIMFRIVFFAGPEFRKTFGVLGKPGKRGPSHCVTSVSVFIPLEFTSPLTGRRA